MRTIEIVNQSVLPIEHESRPLLCNFFSRPIISADQFHIPDPLSRLSKVIKRDLLSIIGKCFIPRTAIQPASKMLRAITNKIPTANIAGNATRMKSGRRRNQRKTPLSASKLRRVKRDKAEGQRRRRVSPPLIASSNASARHARSSSATRSS